MMKNQSYGFLVAAVVSAASCVCHAVDLSQPFDGDSLDDWSEVNAARGQWSGDGDVVEISPKSVSPVVGSPIPGAVDVKALSVDGEVQCLNSAHGNAAYSQTEMLVRIEGPYDTLPSAEDLADVQIAVCAGTELLTGDKVALFAYCFPKDGTGTDPEFVEIARVDTGAWVRVTMISDYEKGLSKLCVDGLPAISSSGYLTADVEWQPNVDGAWYKMPSPPEGNSKVSSIALRGTALFDDVVVTQSEDPDFGAASLDFGIADATLGVTGVTNTLYSSVSKWGVNEATAALARLDDTGLTVGQKLEAGIDPTNGDVLKALYIEEIKSGEEDVQLKIGFNGISPDTWHRFRVSDGNSSSSFEIAYNATEKKWTSTEGAGAPKEVAVTFTSAPGVRYAQFPVAEALRGSRSLAVKVVAVANDSALN